MSSVGMEIKIACVFSYIFIYISFIIAINPRKIIV